ncbi:MAG: xylulokinase [Lachnospiraceae bacterium]|nr:xylulokinase [Lachnospiraceae bacterium]
MRYLIGIDLGTSAAKTIMMDEEGNIICEISKEYPMYQPNNGWAEQNPLDWKNAVIESLKNVMEQSGINKDDVKGIGLSGQMHGLVMLDVNDDPIGNTIIWCDQRSEKQVEEMKKVMPEEEWLRITGNPPIAAWTAAKILWVRENEPEKYHRCKHILLPKDYIRFVLTGKYATDVSDASGMQLMDIEHRCWSDTILDKLDIDLKLLGEMYESQEIVGNVKKDIAVLCGLSEETAVIAGASDNASAAIGTGIIRSGQAFTSIGTSAIVYTHLDHYKAIPEGSLHVCCCAVPGCWHTMGGPQAAALSMNWFEKEFCELYRLEAEKAGISIHEYTNQKIEKIPVGSDRLLYMPFLMGERTPHMNPNCRGTFIGINAVHTRDHFLRAIMEGVTHSLADCNNILKTLGEEIHSMRVCGGGSRSKVWRQIMADMYGCEIKTINLEEGPAFGVAILAGVATGVFKNIYEVCDKFIKDKEIMFSIKENVEIYEKYHRLYDKIYKDIVEDYDLLAKL